MIEVVKNKQMQSAVDYAKGLLERCVSGEVVAITAVEELPGGMYQVNGSSTTSKTSTAGMLLDAAITRLNQ